MNSQKSIIVVMSPSRRATPALHRAMAYAHHTNAILHLLLFDYYGPIDHSRTIFGDEVADRARHDFLDERMKWLTSEAGALAQQGIRVECDVIWAPSPYKSIIGKILEIKPDLVVKDVDCETQGDQLLRPSSLDWKLLRLSPAPLMLVHPRSKLVPHHVLASVDVTVAGDEGQLNDRVMETAQSLASLSEAQVDLVSIFSYVPLDTYASGFIADTFDIMNTAHRESLEKFAAKHKIRPMQVIRRSGFDVSESIASCARDRSADMVVLGSAYRSGFDRIMFGTVAEGLIRKLQCDVLLVKPVGFEMELSKHLKIPEQHVETGTKKSVEA